MLRDPASYHLTCHPPSPTGWYTYDGPYTASRVGARLTACLPALRLEPRPVVPLLGRWTSSSELARARCAPACSSAFRPTLLLRTPLTTGAVCCVRARSRFTLLARVRARGYSPSIDGTPTKDMVRAPTASAHDTPAALDLLARRPSRARVPCPRYVPPLASVTPFVRLRVRQ